MKWTNRQGVRSHYFSISGIRHGIGQEHWVRRRHVYRNHEAVYPSPLSHGLGAGSGHRSDLEHEKGQPVEISTVSETNSTTYGKVDLIYPPST